MRALSVVVGAALLACASSGGGSGGSQRPRPAPTGPLGMSRVFRCAVDLLQGDGWSVDQRGEGSTLWARLYLAQDWVDVLVAEDDTGAVEVGLRDPSPVPRPDFQDWADGTRQRIVKRCMGTGPGPLPLHVVVGDPLPCMGGGPDPLPLHVDAIKQ